MTRSRSIWIIGIALLVGALAVAAILYRDSLGREIINSALQDTDYEVVSLSVRSLSKDEIRLAELALEHKDGMRIVVAGVTLPVNLRERRITRLALEFVELIPSATDTEPTSYAELLALGMSANRLAPGIEVSIGVLRVPWLPDMSRVLWRTAPDRQSVNFDIDEFSVAANAREAASGHELALTVTMADGTEALTWSGKTEMSGDDVLLAGEAQASAEHWLPVLHALGAIPTGLRSVDAQIYGNVSVLVPGDVDGQVGFGGTLWSDVDVDIAYVTESGEEYAISAAGFDALAWQFSWPSLEWQAALEKLQPRVSPGGEAPVTLQLADIGCRAGVECKLVTAFVARDLTRDRVAIGSVRATAPIVVRIGDVITVQSTQPATIKLGRIRYQDWLLKALELTGNLGLADTNYSAGLDFRAGEGISGKLQASYDQQSGKGMLKVTGATLDFGRTKASAVFDGWPYEWDILRGQLRADAALQLVGGEQAGAVAGDLDVSFSGIAGSWRELAFAGLNFVATARLGAASGLEVSPFDAEMALFDVGFPVENIRARIVPDLAAGSIALDTVQMHALGGNITLDPFVYSLTAETNKLVVRPAGIQLPLIVDLLDSEALTVEGSVSGEIPVSITKQGITADRGRIRNDPPGGAIRFRSGIPGLGGADGSSQVGVVTKALSNFEFTSMTSDVSYTAAGDLLLQMRVEGVNPTMDPKQPIVLNLGVEDNVPQLLKSLQAARSISDILGRKFAK